MLQVPVRLERRLIRVDLVQEEKGRVAQFLMHVEAVAARLALDRGAGVTFAGV